MKRYLLSTFTIAAAALLVTSCNDEMDNGLKTGDEGTVTFTAQLPSEMGTRAFADGLTAKHLQYAVYEAGQSTPLKVFGDETTVVGEAEMNNLKQTVSLKLTTGKTYDVIFWAADNSAKKPYTFDPLTQTVKITYTNVYSNNDICDAFFKKETITVSGNQNVDVKLTRPFAQVNFGTADLLEAAAAGFVPKQSVFTATDVANVFDTFNAEGKVEGPATDKVTFAAAELPAEPLVIKDGTKYAWMTMNYIIPVGKQDEKHISNVTAEFVPATGDAITASSPQTPVKNNYRTNILGNLLTSQVIFNIEIVPIFNEPDNDIDLVNIKNVESLKALFRRRSHTRP